MKYWFTIAYLFLTIPVFAQFNLAETNYLNQCKDDEMINIVANGNITPLLENAQQIDYLVKHSFQHFAAISIKKQQLNDLVNTFKDIRFEIPLGKGHLLMDTTLIHNRIIEVHNGLSPLTQAYLGNDVIVGILDAGIYFDHPDFKNADGTTRIRYIWDQNENTPTTPPAPYNYGQEWSWLAINNGSCNHVEPSNQFGHGTTVAGAACGNGLATGTHTGVAPNAEIIAVAVDYYGNDFLANTLDAIDYVFKKADALGKPCVINTSFGSYYGSHDGKDITTQYIEALLNERSGRVIVASAGNGNNINETASNFTPAHLSYPITTDTNFTWFRAMNNGQLYFDLWTDVGQFEQAHFSIGVNDNSTFLEKGRLDFLQLTDFSGDLLLGIYKTEFVFDNTGASVGKVEMYAEEHNGRYHLEFLITPNNTSDLWSLLLTGSGTFDLWSSSTFQGTSNMVHTNLPPNFVLPAIDFYQFPDNKKSIVSNWQCSDQVITVGNFANQAQYYDVDSIQRFTGNTPGEIYYKSSEGPTRDNRLKPDITASGNLTFASGNLDFISAALNSNRPKVALGAMHNYNGGTSMSSPIVAGAVALYLEKNPDAWWYEVKEALIQTALKDSFTGASENTQYGHGKLNGFQLMQFEAILGCTNDTMFNYNPQANVDDGSCIPFIYGCTDSTALNYNAMANTDDGSCIPIVYGCMDSSALNYNPQANVDDGSCEYEDDTTSIRSIIENNMSIHPNPSTGVFQVQFSSLNKSMDNQIKITDVNGKIILTKTIDKQISLIDLSQYENGIYFINLMENANIVAIQKIVLQR